MKALPKRPPEITELTTKIAAARNSIEAMHADIGRASAAAREAERLDNELSALSDKRARLKAEAFISGTKADLAELDRKEAELDKASRRAREDGKAGAIAVQLLEEKIEEAQAVVDGLIAERRRFTVEWLSARREAAVDRYIEHIQALGPIVAEAVAVDRMRARIAGISPRYVDPLLAIREAQIPVPGNREEVVGTPPFSTRRPPFKWMLDSQLGAVEYEALADELESAGVLP
jgi:hypothetical protein